MVEKPTKEFGVYHWDTFDDEVLLVAEADSLVEAEELVQEKYGDRITADGADRLDIVRMPEGDLLKKYSLR